MNEIKLLEKTLYRFNETDFEEILGNQTIKILRLLNNDLLYTKEIRKISLELFGEKFFITNNKARSLLINALRVEDAEKLADELNIKYKDQSELYQELVKKKIIKNSSSEEKFFEFFGIGKEEEITDLETSLETFNTSVTPSYPLFKHQRIAVKEITSFLNNSPNRVMLHMPTGAGKTRTAMNIISNYFRANEDSLVIWLATTEELCQQAFDEFQKAWSSLGDREINVFKLWGNESLIEEINKTDGLVIAGLPKLNSIINGKNGMDKFIDFSTKLDFIIMDEAHQAIAPTYQFIIDTIFNLYTNKTKKLLGLSATPGRTWNDMEEDLKLSNFFSRNKVTLKVEGYNNAVDYLVSEGYLAKVNYKSVDYVDVGGLDRSSYNFEKYSDIPNAILKILGDDEQRNIKILLHSEDLAKRHNRIIIFAPSVGSSNLIAFLLKYKNYNAFSLTGDTDSNMRKRIIEDFKNNDDEVKILVNYGILTTGFDAPGISAAIIARPTMSLVLFSQMVGRAIRGTKAGGNKEAEILTVIDKSLPGFNSVAEAFLNWEDVWKNKEDTK